VKYRTLIEIICDASDSEEASNIAGDYLKGDVDFGVDMRCKTISLWSHRVKKYTVASIVTVLVFSSLLIKVTPVAEDDKGQASMQVGFKNTSTIMPALKTKHKSDFKKEWEEKKDEEILKYIKE